LKILISGFYGAGNAGDEAILSAIMTSIMDRNNDSEFTALSFNPLETTNSHMINAIYRPDFGPKWFSTNLRVMLSSIKNSDLVIIGGGGLLEDKHNYFSIPRYLHTVILAKIYNKPVMYYSIGVGPIKNKIGKLLVGIITQFVDLITVRDIQSKNTLVSLGIRPECITVVPDPVFSLKPIKESDAKKIFLSEKISLSQKPLIGISVRSLEWGKLPEDEFALFLDTISKKYNATIIFIPFGYDGVPTDLDISMNIINKMTQEVYIIKNKYHPEEIMGLIGELDFFIGMRFHSVILCSLMGVPVLGISYLPKVNSILNSLGYTKYYPAENNIQELRLEDLVNSFETLYINKDSVKNDVDNMVKPLIKDSSRPAELINTISNKVVPKPKLIYVSCIFIGSLFIFGLLQIYRSRISKAIHP
jgi:polysaccharide pyruvyl transferase CsaB